ncbi:hypothetical protein Plhal304r1_c003g0009601 [Plasmopara halstedii]
MLDRFVLSPRHDRDKSHVKLIPNEIVSRRRILGGLGAPSLDAQRLAILLQLMRAELDDSEH